MSLTVTVQGFTGALTCSDEYAINALAMVLIDEGYGVKVNALRVAVNYGPGYNTLEWAEGEHAGEALVS
jgi:hypothetical protein